MCIRDRGGADLHPGASGTGAHRRQQHRLHRVPDPVRYCLRRSQRLLHHHGKDHRGGEAEPGPAICQDAADPVSDHWDRHRHSVVPA